jgi:membrane protease YdiL (CAAX protease family)
MNDQLWWYVARASGTVSWALLALSVVWGLTLSTRWLGRRARPNWLLDLHRFLGGAGVVFVAVHVAALVADSYTTVHGLTAGTDATNPILLGAMAATSVVVAVLTASKFRRPHPRPVPRVA